MISTSAKLLKAAVHHMSFAQIYSLNKLLLVAENHSQSADLIWQILFLKIA